MQKMTVAVAYVTSELPQTIRSAKQACPAPSAVRQPAARSELWAQKYHEQLVERVQSVDENQVCQAGEGWPWLRPLCNAC